MDADKSSAAEPLSQEPRDVYCYFDNTDVKLRAPVDARSLMHKLGIARHSEEDAVARPSRQKRREPHARGLQGDAQSSR